MFDLFRKTKKAAALDGIAKMLDEHDNVIARFPVPMSLEEQAPLMATTLKHIRHVVQIGQKG